LPPRCGGGEDKNTRKKMASKIESVQTFGRKVSFINRIYAVDIRVMKIISFD